MDGYTFIAVLWVSSLAFLVAVRLIDATAEIYIDEEDRFDGGYGCDWEGEK